MIRLSRWGDFALLVSGRNMRILTSLLPQLMVDESESVDIAVVVDSAVVDGVYGTVILTLIDMVTLL